MAYKNKEDAATWQRTRRKKHRQLLARFKQTKGCATCGYKSHPIALQFDHIEPASKSVNRSGSAIDPIWSKHRIKQELAKCQVLCANCHAIRTYEERHYYNETHMGY